MTERKGPGCGTAVVLLFSISIFCLIGAGIYLRIMVPKWLRTVDEEAIPWVESKGRALAGKVTMRPLYTIIEESDLTKKEKKEWKAFLDTNWEDAWTSDDQHLEREDLINEALNTATTRAGYYYLFKHVIDKSLDQQHRQLGVKSRRNIRTVMQRAMLAIADGTLSPEDLKPVRKKLLWVVSDVRVTSKSKVTKVRESSVNLKDAARHIYDILRKREKPDAISVTHIPDAFRQDLDRLAEKIVALKADKVNQTKQRADMTAE